ncbi:MAG: HEAT repeat domain-containing protein [Terriglobia bacterium]
MRRSLAVSWVLVLLILPTEIPFLFGQAPSSGTTQGSVPPANSSTTATNPLSSPLKSSNEKVRARAARDLGKAQDASAIPALAAALSDPSQKVRREVILALAQIHQPGTLAALIKATEDADEGNRVLAVQSLVGYYTGIIPTPGISGFLKKEVKRAQAHFTPDTTRIDPGLSVDPNVITALDAALKDTRSHRASREAAKGLGILVARAAVPDLIKAAHSSDETLSLEALNALSKIEARSAGGELVDLLDSPDKDIKQQASVTIGILRTGQAVPKLQSIFESDTNQKSKEKALEGLAYLGAPASSPLFTKALWSGDKVIRTSAAEGLARTADPKTLPELEKAVMAEKDADAKLAIEYAITALGKLDYLSDIVNELSSRTRGDIAQPYLIELARTPGFLPKLYPYLQSPNAGVRKRLCTVIMFSGDQTSLDQLDRLSHDPNGDVSAQALRAKRAVRARLEVAGTTPTTGSH